MPRKKLAPSVIQKLLQLERDKISRVHQMSGKIMLSLSGGAASAVAAIRAKEWWGDRVVCVFADTCSEDADLYRFLDDLEPLVGPIVRLKQSNEDGTDMDIWDCFDKHGIMRIPKAGNACKASVELKQKPLDAYAALHRIRLLAVGYGVTEPERMSSLKSVLRGRTNQIVLFPLCVQPLLSDCEIIKALEQFGVRAPAVYKDGFVHNNCLGAGGCILSGLAQFAAVKRLMPDAFEYARNRSQAFFDRTGFSVLRDQRNGSVAPYTLVQLEGDIEAGREFGNAWNSNCSCMNQQQTLFD